MKNIVFSFLLSVALPATASYSGRVFVDKNNNGILDKNGEAARMPAGDSLFFPAS